MQQAIDDARVRGSVVVASAGNSNRDASLQYPANCDGVIAGASTDQNGAKASFSNYGDRVAIAAPGVSIITLSNNGPTVPADPVYVYAGGTSMSAPLAASMVALMQAAAPMPLTPDRVGETLRATARPLPGACTQGCGAGIVNAGDAARAAINSGAVAPNRASVANFTATGFSGRRVIFTDSSTDRDGQTVAWYWTFEDGPHTKRPVASRTFVSPGTHKIMLMVVDDKGGVGSKTGYMRINN